MLFTQVAAAQSAPLAGRPTNYSHLVGRFKIAARVEPTTVVVEEPMTLRVEISGELSGHDLPSRDRLRIFPDDLGTSFYIEPRPDLDNVAADRQAWTFVWKLRPKSAGAIELPSLSLVYYSPQLRRYQTARTDPILLDVKPRTIPSTDPWWQGDIPASFFQLSGRAFGSKSDRGWRWFLIGLGIALGVWLIAPRPVPAKGSGVLNFTAELDQCPEESPAIVAHYLRERWKLTEAEAPLERDRILRRAGMPAPLRQRWRDWHNAAAAARYGPAAAEADFRQLANQAKQLILELDEKPSARALSRGDAFLLRAVGILILTYSLLAAWPVDNHANFLGRWDPWPVADNAFRGGVSKWENGELDQAQFQKAAEAFRECLTDESGARAYRNLGDACFLAGELPEAIAAFQAAWRIEPNDTQLGEQLNFARRQVVMPAESKLRHQERPWFRDLPIVPLRRIVPIAVLPAGLLLGFGIARRSRFLLVAGGVCAAIGTLSWGVMAVRHAAIEEERREDVVVIRSDTPLRLGNAARFEANPDAPMLPRGYEVRVLDKRGGWLHIACPGGAIGWVPEVNAVWFNVRRK